MVFISYEVLFISKDHSDYNLDERLQRVNPLLIVSHQIFSLQVMREGGFSTPLCHYAIILRPKNPHKLNGIPGRVEILDQMWLSHLLFPDHLHCPSSPICLSLTPQKLNGANSISLLEVGLDRSVEKAPESRIWR